MGDDTYDLDAALKEAADRFREKLRNNPDELYKRLERRKTAMLSRPLRAWCLAVRAGDRRINSTRAILTPGEAMRYGEEHSVLLDARLLRWLCRPVRIPFPGLPASEVARMLGCKGSVVMEAAKKGALDVKRFKGLGGAKTWVPVVYAARYLDPSAGNLHRMGDPLWGTACRFLSDHVPEDVQQVVKRVPHVQDSIGKFIGWRWVCPGCKRKVKLLFYPMPAMVKVRILLPGEVDGRTRVAQPRVSHGRQECPPHHSQESAGGRQECPPLLRTFACRECHKVVFFSRASGGAWNLFISRLTDGMLYGSEVRRPADFPNEKEARTRPVDRPDAHAPFVVCKYRHRKKRRGPMALSGRRKRVRDMLVENRTRLEMMAELGVTLWTIKEDIRRVMGFYGVGSREELAEKMGRKLPPHLSPRARRVMEMLVEGKRYGEIAGELGMAYSAAALFAKRIYKAYGLRKGWRRRERFLKRVRKGRGSARLCARVLGRKAA